MERRVTSIVNDKDVSSGRIELALWREGGGKCVPRQLVNLIERARLMIAIIRPVEQLGQMILVPNADLRQRASLAAPALNPIILVAIGRMAGVLCRARAASKIAFHELAFDGDPLS